jgi:two-component system, cell cycle sensor histidine kinase and response regulator CckA
MDTRIRRIDGDAPARGSQRRILVVDDDATIRNILVQVLKLQGYDVQAATNGIEAFELCGDQSFDVLITDLMMPLMGGRELIEKARTVQPGMRVICLSASFSEAWLDLSVLFLPKPFSLRSIVALVKSALDNTRRRQAETG